MEAEYKVKFYKSSVTGKVPVLEYLRNLTRKERLKIGRYIERLRISKGYLDEPYSRHVKGKIRELRVDFSKNYHRIFYFTFVGKNIIMLHAYYKKSKRIPGKELNRAISNYNDFINNLYLYDL